MKFCKDCKWYVAEKWSVPSLYMSMYRIDQEHCSNPHTRCKCDDPVNGEITKWKFECGIVPRALRLLVKACGPTAKWYEEKEKPIPNCKDCKYFTNSPGLFIHYCNNKLAEVTVPDPVWGEVIKYPWQDMHELRADEAACGKYGKWWEKKEKPIAAITEYEFIPAPKKQSWLCRLICGRKK